MIIKNDKGEVVVRIADLDPPVLMEFRSLRGSDGKLYKFDGTETNLKSYSKELGSADELSQSDVWGIVYEYLHLHALMIDHRLVIQKEITESTSYYKRTN